MNITLNMAMCQANAETFQLMEIDHLLGYLKVKADSVDLSDDDQIEIFNTLEKSISLVLQ